MTTQREYKEVRRELRLVSSCEDPALWTHPQLDLYSLSEIANKKKFEPLPQQSAKLYLIPSSFGEECMDFLTEQLQKLISLRLSLINESTKPYHLTKINEVIAYIVQEIKDCHLKDLGTEL